MSVTVEGLLKLPCLREARVLAGRRGLGRIVSSVSVLEYANPGELLESLYASNEWSGGEIVISGLINVRYDVEAQCFNIRRMAGVGEVGLILYYVGIFLPAVDRRLIELCDELDFPLICMPEGRMNLRYSEVICEVMEAVFKDQQSDTQLVSAILDRVALLPEHQRSVGTVLKMLSDRVRSSVVLADSHRRVLNAALWPRTLGADLGAILQGLGNLPEPGGGALTLESGTFLYRCGVDTEEGMDLFLFKEGDPLPPELTRQAGEVVRLAVNIWSQGHARVVVSELVRAILKDEPLKMRRLADIFHIDVSSIQTMWVLRCAGEEGREAFRSRAPELVQEVLSHRCRTVVADFYEGDMVVFMDAPASAGDGTELAGEVCARLRAEGIRTWLTLCQELATTNLVRRAFLTNAQALPDALKIWPGREWYTLQEVAFAQNCRELTASGEAAAEAALEVLSPLAGEREAGALERTLCVYLLDAESSVSRTAELLYLHKNTVKYRLQRIGARLGHGVNKMPESFALYRACALRRMLEG